MPKLKKKLLKKRLSTYVLDVNIFNNLNPKPQYFILFYTEKEAQPLDKLENV